MIIKLAITETLRAKHIIAGFYFLIIILYLVEISFWQSITQYDNIGNYTRQDIVNYSLWAILIYQLTSVNNFCDSLALSIEDGTVDKLLTIPIHIIWFYTEYSIGVIFSKALLLSPLIIGICMFQNGYAIFSGAIMIVLGALINLYMSMIIACFAFKIRGVYSFTLIKDTIAWIMSGALIPVDLFPRSIQGILNYLPFQYISFVPAKVMMGANISLYLPHALLVMFTEMIILTMFWRHCIRFNQGYNGNA